MYDHSTTGCCQLLNIWQSQMWSAQWCDGTAMTFSSTAPCCSAWDDCKHASDQLLLLLLGRQAKTLSSEVVRSAHAGRISGVVFPHGYSKVFATCGRDGVRLWETATRKQLLRIQAGNLDCTSIIFSKVCMRPALFQHALGMA